MLRGYELPSICHLCRLHAESLEHLFLFCSLAQEVWKYFANYFHIELPVSGEVKHSFLFWMNHTHSENQMHVRFIIPLLGFWNTWSDWNAAKHTRRRPYPRKIISDIILTIQRAYSQKLYGFQFWKRDLHVAMSWGLHIAHNRKVTAQQVIWKRPPTDWLKLNYNGSAMGNPRPAVQKELSEIQSVIL